MRGRLHNAMPYSSSGGHGLDFSASGHYGTTELLAGKHRNCTEAAMLKWLWNWKTRQKPDDE